MRLRLARVPSFASRFGQRQRTRQFRVAMPVLILVSLCLLVLSRLDHSLTHSVRWRVAEAMTPVLTALFAPLEPVRWAARQLPEAFKASRELEQVRDENQKLKSWEWRAKELERKLQDVTELARTVRETGFEFVTARVIANSSGAFVRSAMINAGQEQNVKIGHPVISGDGIVGRVVDTGGAAARVLLLTDLNSRIPVLVGNNHVRAVLSGDNGATPRLTYLPADAVVAAGDDVVTSGIGGLFPRGMKIGSVVETPRGLRVKPDSNLDALEYVSVLLYQSPALDMTEAPRSNKAAEAELPQVRSQASTATVDALAVPAPKTK
jgi:rod shape-determining protein MreC